MIIKRPQHFERKAKPVIRIERKPFLPISLPDKRILLKNINNIKNEKFQWVLPGSIKSDNKYNYLGEKSLRSSDQAYLAASKAMFPSTLRSTHPRPRPETFGLSAVTRGRLSDLPPTCHRFFLFAGLFARCHKNAVNA
jgi:hypothetical protein